jgi:hypothetical protein
MTIAADAPARSPGRTATSVQILSPGYFPFVMATSIISTGTSLLGPPWLARALLVIASAGLAVLLVALVMQLVLFRPGRVGSGGRCPRRADPGPERHGTGPAIRREKVS